MTKLDDYLKERPHVTNAEFGVLVGASEATISRLRNRKQTPSLRLMRKIAEATGGAVSPNDFLQPSRTVAA